MSKKYYSDELVLPGETIREVMSEYGVTQKELASRIDYTPKHINEVIKGKSQITVEFAIRLERVFGLKTSFWLALESNYREQLVKLGELEQLQVEEDIAREIPYSFMANLLWVTKTRKIEKKVEYLRSFFRVSKLTQIESVYDCAFREKGKDRTSGYAQAAWIARGEQIASTIHTEHFNMTRLKRELESFRGMTLLSPNEFIPLMRELCREIGIAIAFVPKLPKTYAHGATKWIRKDKVLIQLSLRYKYADIFWFSFFHEIAHLLLHGKQIPYMIKNDEKEIEADEMASAILIPQKAYADFITANDLSLNAIIRFAEKINIHEGIVIGRLMHDQLLEFNELSRFRIKYDWIDTKN